MHRREELKRIQTRLGISTREVAARSKKIAEQEKNTAFLISNSWLTQIETSSAALPSVHKLFTLACIYHVGCARLLSLYGVDIQKIAAYHDQMPTQKTHPIRADALEEQTAVELPVRFDSGLNLSRTNLLSRMIEAWGQVPLELVRRLDLRHRSYGFIGLDDYSMYPLLRPGSFVQIDPEVRTPKRARSAPNLIGPFISSISGTSMLVLGASCMKASYSWFRIRFRLANIGCSPRPTRLRLLAK